MVYHLYITFKDGEHAWNVYETEPDVEIAIDYFASRDDVAEVECAEGNDDMTLQWETVYKRR